MSGGKGGVKKAAKEEHNYDDGSMYSKFSTFRLKFDKWLKSFDPDCRSSENGISSNLGINISHKFYIY